jgi:hypothetical protein
MDKTENQNLAVSGAIQNLTGWKPNTLILVGISCDVDNLYHNESKASFQLVSNLDCGQDEIVTIIFHFQHSGSRNFLDFSQIM